MNTIVISKDNYKNLEDFFNDYLKITNVLLNNHNIFTTRLEDNFAFVIEFEHDENEDPWGCKNPYWITADEYWDVISKRGEAERVSKDRDTE